MRKRKEAANKGLECNAVLDVRVSRVFGILATTQASFVSCCPRFCASRHHQARVSTEMLRLPGPGGTRPAARLCLATRIRSHGLVRARPAANRKRESTREKQSRRKASLAVKLDVVRRALPREAAEGATPAGSGSTNAQAKGLTHASAEAFLAGEWPASRRPTEGASGMPSNAGRQSLR